MNGYICFWNSRRIEIYTNTAYEAQKLATIEFQKLSRKKVKEYDVNVMLAERDGKEVTHTADF